MVKMVNIGNRTGRATVSPWSICCFREEVCRRSQFAMIMVHIHTYKTDAKSDHVALGHLHAWVNGKT